MNSEIKEVLDNNFILMNNRYCMKKELAEKNQLFYGLFTEKDFNDEYLFGNIEGFPTESQRIMNHFARIENLDTVYVVNDIRKNFFISGNITNELRFVESNVLIYIFFITNTSYIPFLINPITLSEDKLPEIFSYMKDVIKQSVFKFKLSGEKTFKITDKNIADIYGAMIRDAFKGLVYSYVEAEK